MMSYTYYRYEAKQSTAHVVEQNVSVKARMERNMKEDNKHYQSQGTATAAGGFIRKKQWIHPGVYYGFGWRVPWD